MIVQVIIGHAWHLNNLSLAYNLYVRVCSELIIHKVPVMYVNWLISSGMILWIVCHLGHKPLS